MSTEIRRGVEAGEDCIYEQIKKKKEYVCTLRLKSLWPLGSLWGKTTLNSAVWAGQGQTLKPEKWVHHFLCPWQFPFSNKMDLRKELSKEFPLLLQ